MATYSDENEALFTKLRLVVGAARVRTDPANRAFFSTDLYAAGACCAAVVSPGDVQALSRVVAATTGAGYALVPRGGGMTYVGGYIPPHEKAILVDLSLMNRIIEINPEDMYIRVEAGVTWKQIHDALTPYGLRLPFLGTFSGAAATVGGGLSNGAVFFGSARYGSAAEIVLGIDLVISDGSIIRTGQAGINNAVKPFYRNYGPDLTGVIVHDAGAFGIKAAASLRLIRMPQEIDYLSFGFQNQENAVAALSEIARADLTEEAYVMDPVKTREAMATGSLRTDMAALLRVVGQERRLLKGLAAGIKIAVSGRRFVKENFYSLHLVCSGRSLAAVQSDLEQCRTIARANKGLALPDTIPRAARATLFPPLDALVGPSGERWIALNAKVAHSDALMLVRRADEIIESYRGAMDERGIVTSSLLTILSNHCFSYEPVFHWTDAWLPLHRQAPTIQSGKLREPDIQPEATSLVLEMRERLVALFHELGAASNQIGRTYPYYDALSPETAKFVRQIKYALDPDGLINPGVLGLP